MPRELPLGTHVEFRSDRFPPFDWEPKRINAGRHGKRLADFLHAGMLEVGLAAGEPNASLDYRSPQTHMPWLLPFLEGCLRKLWPLLLHALYHRYLPAGAESADSHPFLKSLISNDRIASGTQENRAAIEFLWLEIARKNIFPLQYSSS
ncbi:MAG: hypothetical protein JO353_11715 [Phycisphaerae bacterium]|nr:hypothetical protein [Phycisphaerae bacterium]